MKFAVARARQLIGSTFEVLAITGVVEVWKAFNWLSLESWRNIVLLLQKVEDFQFVFLQLVENFKKPFQEVIHFYKRPYILSGIEQFQKKSWWGERAWKKETKTESWQIDSELYNVYISNEN